MFTQAAKRFWTTARAILRASSREAQVTRTSRNWVGRGMALDCSEVEERSPQRGSRDEALTKGVRRLSRMLSHACHSERYLYGKCAFDGRTEGKCPEEADGGLFDTIGKKSCFRGSHRWSKIRLRGRIVDAAAVEWHRTSFPTVCGSGERSSDKE